jgi:hypothetical protein
MSSNDANSDIAFILFARKAPGGGGRESNPPATILAAKPVLKTGKATGPFPPPCLDSTRFSPD